MEASQGIEQQMLAQHALLEKMKIQGNCLYEKEIDVCAIRIALDIGLLTMPEGVNPEEKVPLRLEWPNEFKAWEFSKSIQCVLFASIAMQQGREDAAVALTVAVARVIESMKHLQSLTVGGLKAEESSADTETSTPLNE